MGATRKATISCVFIHQIICVVYEHIRCPFNIHIQLKLVNSLRFNTLTFWLNNNDLTINSRCFFDWSSLKLHETQCNVISSLKVYVLRTGVFIEKNWDHVLKMIHLKVDLYVVLHIGGNTPLTNHRINSSTSI